MEETLFDILNQLKTTDYLDERTLTKTINRHNKRLLERANGAKEPQNTRPISKRRLMQYYLDVKRSDPDRWAAWQLTSEEERRLVRTLQMKPRRTASGVATITVLTKPWKCSSNCLYCPNDLRMPKSYMSDEPACQRAERTFFDPYWQVTARLKALTEMGHVTDKVELI
ncbi:MAG: histone acetyltransferase, partial [Eggerthellaceae bacterium]